MDLLLPVVEWLHFDVFESFPKWLAFVLAPLFWLFLGCVYLLTALWRRLW
jgi:hypothetical protein